MNSIEYFVVQNGQGDHMNKEPIIIGVKPTHYWGIFSLVIGIVSIAILLITAFKYYNPFHPLFSLLFVLIEIIALGFGIKGLTHYPKAISIFGVVFNICGLLFWIYLYGLWYIFTRD